MNRWLLSLTLFCSATAFAADPGADGNWPQWRGPNRDDISKETGLLAEWPKGGPKGGPKAGPKQLWKMEGLGTGYSTPSFSDGKIFVLGSKVNGKGRDEYLFVLDQKDGSKIGDVKIGAATGGGGYEGPRSTPTIDNGLAYAISSGGNFVCVDIKKMAIRWEKNFKKEFNGASGGWDYTESPLIDGDVVIATPGGATATIVAMQKADGEVVWKSPVKVGMKGNYATAAYASMIKAEIDGVPQYIQFLTGGVVGVAAKDGKLLWHYDAPANGTANCSTPLFKDNAVFAASAYGKGGGRADITKTTDGFKAEDKYFLKEMENHHGGMVLVGDHVYGTGNGTLYCVDFKSGDVVWKEPKVGKGAVTYADGHLYVREENGGVVLAEANPKKYVEKGRFAQPDRSSKSAWAHPVVVGGKLYLRDYDVMFCYDVKK